jgi:hypothetical protein
VPALQIDTHKYGLKIQSRRRSMSLSHKTDFYETPLQNANRKRSDFGFVLALVCIALVLVLASAIFTPVSVGNGISSEISLVGP